MKTHLRWKLQAIPSGPQSAFPSPRASWLHDGKLRYACVYGRRRGGWYWVAGWDSCVPSRNTWETPVKTEQEAKTQALAYVKQHLATPSKEPQ